MDPCIIDVPAGVTESVIIILKLSAAAAPDPTILRWISLRCAVIVVTVTLPSSWPVAMNVNWPTPPASEDFFVNGKAVTVWAKTSKAIAEIAEVNFMVKVNISKRGWSLFEVCGGADGFVLIISCCDWMAYKQSKAMWPDRIAKLFLTTD